MEAGARSSSLRREPHLSGIRGNEAALSFNRITPRALVDGGPFGFLASVAKIRLSNIIGKDAGVVKLLHN